MCKNHRNVAITIGIILFIFVISFVVATSNFFTNDNIEKYTIAKSTVACKYTEKILEEPKEQEKIAQISEENATVSQKSTSEKVNSNSQKVSEPKNTNQEATMSKQQMQTNESKTQVSETKPKEEANKVQQNEVQNNTQQKAVQNNTQQKTVQNNTQANTVPSQYNGLSTIGRIEIPRTGVNMPILSKVTAKGMEVAPCLLYSTGKLNVNGNNLIVGHNYNSIFSRNKDLQIGDKIYITTLDGKRVEYTVYNKFLATPEETSYIKRNTNNLPEITLSTCTDDDNYRMIIVAKI